MSKVQLEMERDSLISQGTPHTIKDRLADQSDKFTCYVCRYCGLLAIANPKTKRFECTICETDQVIKLNTTYGWKLVLQELMAMNVVPRMLVDVKKGTFTLNID